MKRFVAAALVLSLTLGASAGYAGGPVVIEEEGQPEVVATSPRSGWIVPVIIGLVVVCAIACGSDDEEPTPGPGPAPVPVPLPGRSYLQPVLR